MDEKSGKDIFRSPCSPRKKKQTWEDLDEFAIGEIGIAPDLFELMTWRELDLHVRGYFLRLARQKWMMREIIWNMWATITPSDKFNLERKGIMILPWDEEDEPRREFTPEELDEISKRFDRAIII